MEFRLSDGLDLKTSFRWSGPELFMSVSRLTRFQLVVFFCFSIPVVLFDISGISKCFNTLFLLSPHLCFIIGFVCDSFVARNDSWMSYTATRTEQIYVFTTMEAEGESLDPVKLA